MEGRRDSQAIDPLSDVCRKSPNVHIKDSYIEVTNSISQSEQIYRIHCHRRCGLARLLKKNQAHPKLAHLLRQVGPPRTRRLENLKVLFPAQRTRGKNPDFRSFVVSIPVPYRRLSHLKPIRLTRSCKKSILLFQPLCTKEKRYSTRGEP